jgi:hypothetical protein
MVLKIFHSALRHVENALVCPCVALPMTVTILKSRIPTAIPFTLVRTEHRQVPSANKQQPPPQQQLPQQL